MKDTLEQRIDELELMFLTFVAMITGNPGADLTAEESAAQQQIFAEYCIKVTKRQR